MHKGLILLDVLLAILLIVLKVWTFYTNRKTALININLEQAKKSYSQAESNLEAERKRYVNRIDEMRRAQAMSQRIDRAMHPVIKADTSKITLN